MFITMEIIVIIILMPGDQRAGERRAFQGCPGGSGVNLMFFLEPQAALIIPHHQHHQHHHHHHHQHQHQHQHQHHPHHRHDNQVKGLVTSCSSPYTASEGSHAVVVCTEWDEFTTLDWEKVGTLY